MGDDIKSEATYSLLSVRLRIATGASGQNGLLQALSEAFIRFLCEKDKCPPFLIEWYKSDTTVTIDYLRRELVDVGITYHGVAERAALQDYIIDRVEYAWRDHWMLVGPKSNPAKLPNDEKSSIYVLMMKLFSAMEVRAAEVRSGSSGQLIKFLSRYDQSAGNITESSLWATIGHTPWAERPAVWYHKLNDFPFQAIRKAAQLGEYTIVDYGTWCAVEDGVREKLTVFALGKNDESDPLLNAAHLLVGSKAKNKYVANEFANWMVKKVGGQLVVANFKKNSCILHDTIPDGISPLGRADTLLRGGSGGELGRRQKHHRAIVEVSDLPNNFYFLQDTQYVRVDHVKDTLTVWPASLKGNWPGITSAGLEYVDAIFQTPMGSADACFFSGTKGVWINFSRNHDTPSKDGAFNIADRWRSLAKVGFVDIDATLPWVLNQPPGAKLAYFFRETKCICIDVENDTVHYPLTDITKRFSSLAKAGFSTIDTCCIKAGTDHKEAWFFSGDKYVKVNLKDDVLVSSEPHLVVKMWKSLMESKFF